MTDTERVPEPTGDTANTQVAARIRAELARQNTTAKEVAARMGVRGQLDPSWLQRRARGTVQITLDDLQWIAAALEVPMAALLTDLLPGRMVQHDWTAEQH